MTQKNALTFLLWLTIFFPLPSIPHNFTTPHNSQLRQKTSFFSAQAVRMPQAQFHILNPFFSSGSPLPVITETCSMMVIFLQYIQPYKSKTHNVCMSIFIDQQLFYSIRNSIRSFATW